MTFPDEMTIYCTICGGPIYDPSDTRIPHPWLSEITLLHHPAPLSGEPPNETVLELPARNNGGPYFTLLTNRTKGENEEKPEVKNNDVTTLDPTDNEKTGERNPLYIPAHTACITLAKRYLTSKDYDVGRGMWHIYAVLDVRFEKASETFRPIPFTNLREPNGYYGADRYQRLEWEAGSDIAVAQHFETPPLPLPNLTASLLSHLHPLPSPASPLPFQRNPPLPLEINQQILSGLSPLSSSSTGIQSTYILSPAQWRDALAGGKMLPWLWDVDAVALAEKDDEGGVWDWERLVRELAQGGIYRPGAVVEGLAVGVRNRRRIWMLVGDLMGGEGGGMD